MFWFFFKVTPPAGMDEDNVAFPDVDGCVFKVAGCNWLKFSLGHIQNHGIAVKPLQRYIIQIKNALLLLPGEAMCRGVHVSSDMCQQGKFSDLVAVTWHIFYTVHLETVHEKWLLS